MIAERGSDFLRCFHQLRDGHADDVIGLEVVRLLDPRVCQNDGTDLVALGSTLPRNRTLKCSSK